MSERSPNTMIAVGLGLILLLTCGGGGITAVLIGILAMLPQDAVSSLSSPSPAPRPVPEVVVEPLTLGLQDRDESVDHTRTKPLVLAGEVSGPPETIGAFESAQCADITQGGNVDGPDCVTGEIHCDQQIIGHTLGGVDLYGTRFYEKKFCWPATVDHDDGNERVYKLVMPPGEWRAWVDLHTPCADLDIAAVRHDHGSRCPDLSSNINQCEMKPADGTGSERIELTSQTGPGQNATWYVIVEGKGTEEGAFSLYVQCSEGLGGGVR